MNQNKSFICTRFLSYNGHGQRSGLDASGLGLLAVAIYHTPQTQWTVVMACQQPRIQANALQGSHDQYTSRRSFPSRACDSRDKRASR